MPKQRFSDEDGSPPPSKKREYSREQLEKKYSRQKELRAEKKEKLKELEKLKEKYDALKKELESTQFALWIVRASWERSIKNNRWGLRSNP